MRVAQMIILRVALAFGSVVGIQWLLLLLPLFGNRPVIVASFFTCVNVLFLLAELPTLLFGLALQIREKAFLWRVLLALVLVVVTFIAAYQLWAVYLR